MDYENLSYLFEYVEKIGPLAGIMLPIMDFFLDIFILGLEIVSVLFCCF